MKNSQKRTCCDISLIHQDGFHDFCRDGNPSSFIRNRKMPLTDLLFTMINRRGITLSLELWNYMKTAHPGDRNIKAWLSEIVNEEIIYA